MAVMVSCVIWTCVQEVLKGSRQARDTYAIKPAMISRSLGQHVYRGFKSRSRSWTCPKLGL